MNYQFPSIAHIDDIRPALEGYPEFILADRGDVIFVQYGIINRDAFSLLEDPLMGAIRRELRGIAFCARTGRILSRPFQKFFNLNEHDEVRFENIDWSQPYRVTNKLDGSMVRPVVVDGVFLLATKMSTCGVAATATEHMRAIPNLQRQLREVYDAGITPLMEWTNPGDQIVVQYDKPALTLLASRDNVTGKYLEEDLGIGIPSVGDHQGWANSTGDIPSKIEQLARSTREEGAVVWFDNGHAFKMKNRWYHSVHKLISEIGVRDVRRHIVKLILEEQYDDLLQFLGSSKMQLVTQFHDLFWQGFQATCKRLEYTLYASKEEVGSDMKAFAMKIAPGITDNVDKKILFQCMHGASVRDEVMKHLKKSTVRDSHWDQAQNWLVGNHTPEP